MRRTKVVATVEARMCSSRLPGKVLMQAMGKPLLLHLVERLREVSSIDEIIVATTTNPADLDIVRLCEEHNIAYYRGSEHDVLGRVVEAAKSAGADVLVEITGDCPLLDPDIVEQTIRMYFHHSVDYASNSIISSYPIGMDAQVITFAVLERCMHLTQDALDREHVSRYLWQRPEQYRFVHLVAPPSLHWPELGLTLDEENDYQLIKRVFESLYPRDKFFGCREIIDLLRENPDFVKINKDIARKGEERDARFLRNRTLDEQNK